MPQMTVLEILNRTKVFFEKKGVPDARLDAEYIICFGLGIRSELGGISLAEVDLHTCEGVEVPVPVASLL